MEFEASLDQIWSGAGMKSLVSECNCHASTQTHIQLAVSLLQPRFPELGRYKTEKQPGISEDTHSSKLPGDVTVPPYYV